MSKLALIGLGKSYGRVAAVADVTLTLQEGEFVSLLGRRAAARPRPCA